MTTDAPARRGVVICLWCREYINAETHPMDPGVCREEIVAGDAAPDPTPPVERKQWT